MGVETRRAVPVPLYLHFFCKTMLLREGWEQRQSPKGGELAFSSSSALCNTMVSRICKTIGKVTACHLTLRFSRICKTMLPILLAVGLPLHFLQDEAALGTGVGDLIPCWKR
jgi:hypothetical protein